MPVDLPGALTRKIGPLPVWAWGGVVGGSVLAFKALTGGGSASPSPTQVTPGAPVEGDGGSGSGGGGGGGGGDTPQPWYATIPGVGTIIDRPPGDVTIIKPPATTPPPTTTPPASTITKLIATVRNGQRGAIYDAKGHRIGYVTEGARNVNAKKVKIGSTYYYRILTGKWAGKYLRAGSSAFTFKSPTSGTGDTIAYAEGDDYGTPLTPQAIVPAAPILPLGILPSAPTFAQGVYRGYHGPSIDSITPIASSARIAMPTINGGEIGGTVLRAALPRGLAKPKPPRNRSRWLRGVPRITIDPIERIAAPVTLAIDRRTSARRAGTTARLPLPAAQRVTTALDNRTGRNVSG